MEELSGKFLDMSRMSELYIDSEPVITTYKELLLLEKESNKNKLSNVSQSLTSEAVYFNINDELSGIANPYKSNEVLKINNNGDGTYSVMSQDQNKNKITLKARVRQIEIRLFLKHGKPFPQGSLYQY